MPADGATNGAIHIATARAALAEEQSRLVRALTRGGPRPHGFDPTGVACAVRALLHKRRRSAARAWPGLASALGERFKPLFDAFAASHPLPAGGAFDDAFAFAVALDRDRRLPDAAKLDVLTARCRHGWPVRMRCLRGPLRLLVAVRLPWSAVRGWTVPLGRPRRFAAPPPR